jgi:signal transduction histidine kinase/integral membrane sensor domain MASE1
LGAPPYHHRYDWPIALLLLTAGCAVAALIAFFSSRIIGGPPPVLTMTGVAMAGMLLGGKKLWPAVILALMPILSLTTVMENFATRLAFAAGIALGAVIGVTVMERLAARRGTSAGAEDIVAIIAGSIAGAAAMSLFGGGLMVLRSLPDTQPWPSFLLGRFFAHCVGALITLPLILSWARSRDERWTAGRLAYLAVILITTAIATYAVFMRQSPGPTAWALYPPMIWAALAFRVRGVTAAILIVATEASIGTAYGFGPFASYAGRPDWTLQCFLVVSVVTMLTLAVLAHERRSETLLRKQANAAQWKAEEAELRLQVAQEAAGAGAWEIGADGNTIFHTPQSEALFGLAQRPGGIHSLAESVQNMDELDRRRAIAAIEAVLADKGRFDFTVTVRTPENSICWVRIVGRYEEALATPRILGMAIDITAICEAEAQARAAQDKLLQVSRLSAMGAMASTLAHELNQPLTAIANLAAASERLLEKDDPVRHDVPISLLRRLGDETLRAGGIIRKMRAFTIRGEIVREPHDIRHIIQSACAVVRARTAGEDVSIFCHIASNVQIALVDRLQIEQVLSNLLMNAVEAVRGCATRRIDLHGTIESGQLLIAVADTGTGLPPDMLVNLFEPFRTTKADGTGLGLPICRTIVEAHGGRLWAEPSERGALLKLAIPIED